MAGVGTELSKLLSWFRDRCNGCGNEPTLPRCETCKQRALTLDANGVEWCKDNTELICQWLMESAQDRTNGASSMPVIVGVTRAIALAAIKRAIYRAERLAATGPSRGQRGS